MDEQTRILIADDHPIFRSGLRQVIEQDPSLCVIGEAGDGNTALAMIVDLAPDVVILDSSSTASDKATTASSTKLPMRPKPSP